MRTVSSNWLDKIGTSRQVKARATFRDTRLQFSTFIPTESTKPTMTDTERTDSSLTRAGFLRIAVDENDVLWYQYVPDPSVNVWPNWVNSAITVGEHCFPGVKGDRIWYINASDAIYYVDFNGTDLDSPVAQGTSARSRAAFAPVSTTECYMIDRETSYDKDGEVERDIYSFVLTRLQSSGGTQTFLGGIFSDTPSMRRFDAVREGDTDHIYFLDRDAGRTKALEITDTIWGNVKDIIPLDVLDENNFFTLGAATTINSRVFVTGRLRRDQNIEMDIYTMGPYHYTMGRELFIVSDAEFTSDVRSKLLLVDDTIYYIGFDFKAKAPATNLVGYDDVDLKLETEEIHSFSVDFTANRSSAIDIGIKSDLTHAAIRRGAEFDLDLGIADGDSSYEWAALCRYGVDGFAQDVYSDGTEQKLIGRSLAMKRLSQWNSDAYYDYWSQAKQVCKPVYLDQMVRTSGTWEPGQAYSIGGPPFEYPLFLTSLNEDGIIYAVAKASRNSIVKAKFRKDSIVEGYDVQTGLILNYYKETRAEAAARLEKDADDIQDDEFGHYGIKVVYREDAGLGWEGIWTYATRAGQDHWLVPAWVDPRLHLPDNTWYWLMASFFEGYISIYYRLDSEQNWTYAYGLVYNPAFYDTAPGWVGGDEPPWFKEERGRGAVFAKNATINDSTPGFTSTSDIIPVRYPSIFPTSETVLVDDEQIEYSGSATADDVPGGFDQIDGAGGPEMIWAEGHTYPQADHANTNWDNILWRTHEWDPTASGEMEFGRVSSTVAYICQFMRSPHGYQRVDKIRIPIKKVGTPTNSIYCYIVNDSIDNAAMTNAYIYMEGSVAPAAVGTDYAWIEFDINTLRNGQPDYYLDPDYKKAYGILLTTVPFTEVDHTPGGAYFDPDNYYVVDMDETLGGVLGRTEGIWLLWNTSTTWDRYYDSFGPDDAIMPFEILGKSPTSVYGYEIYIETADDPLIFAEDEFTDMALVCVEGPGAGLSYKILYYDAAAPKQWVPNRTYDPPEKPEDYVGNASHGEWVDQDLRRVLVADRPSSFGEGSKFEIWPTLLVTQRGANDTNATSHAAGLVSLYREGTIEIDQFEYYSGEVDMRLEDMAFELTRKAGIYDFACEKDMSGDQVFSGSGWQPPAWLSRRNFIVKFETPTLNGTDEEAGVIFRAPTNPTDITTLNEGYMITYLRVGSDYFLKFYKHHFEWILMEQLEGFVAPAGTITISVQGEVFSVWFEERFMAGFTDSDHTDGGYAGIISYGTVTIDVDWSELDIRTDNFVLDMGRRGQQLMDSLIGPKRIFYLDDQSGGIRMGRMRSSGAGDYEIVDLTVEKASTQFDASQMTRLRAEGAEIAEIVDFAEMRTEGNLFAMVNATEANDYWETYEEAERILAEAKSTQSILSPEGFVDPRVEPEDIITTAEDDIIVDRISIRFDVDKTKANMKMDLTGREA